jgi:hypothetical protein
MIEQVRTAAEEALKGTPLVNAQIWRRRGLDREGLARRLLRSVDRRGCGLVSDLHRSSSRAA